MAQFRQSGGGNGLRNCVDSDHVSIGVRGGSRHFNHRRPKAPLTYKISVGLCFSTLFFILSVSAFFYFVLQSKGVEISRHQAQDDETGIDTDFLVNVTRIDKSKDLKFDHGARDESVGNIRTTAIERDNKSSFGKSYDVLDHRGNSLYNEAGRNELKMYEAEYQSSLKNTGESTDVLGKSEQQSGGVDGNHRELVDADEYDDGMDLQDDQMEEYNVDHDETDHSVYTKPHTSNKNQDIIEEADKASNDFHSEETLSKSQHSEAIRHSEHESTTEVQRVRKVFPGRRSGSKKKPKHRRGSCEMKIMNSSTLLVEPTESRKFARFSLQYAEREEKEIDNENWEPRFAGHQSLREREESFIARDQKINCGFVKGPEGSRSTGFDLAEDDANYMSSCHIAVSSCIFGNSDHLRSPMGKTVSRLSKKNVCFVMFVDEVTLQTLSSEGHMPDSMGFIGFWKIVVVKNLPYTDMRRVGKIPKLLPHRLFPLARYSIWLDSKLRLQLDPLLILEYFLWRKGHEYAISNHYDRHCLWEEVSQNKRLNKYNHSVIDEQFSFYQADGMRRFNASDPNKLLPSNVPEGSFIIRAHTPMSNLFSCLWFNEVDRFTPRDQLSFGYTYHKLTRMNPGKPFYLHMFKDCERRKIAKLFRHRSDERKNNQ